MVPDSANYRKKKGFYDRVVTVYGRKPVLEALTDSHLDCHALHLAENNRENDILVQIRSISEKRQIPVKYHSRQELARISRNGKQDQGVALDIVCPAFQALDDYLEQLPTSTKPQRLLALDGITNPQNLGMIIRSATAGGMDGVIWARRGNASLGPLVIKASAGTLYRAPLLVTASVSEGLGECHRQGMEICGLDASAEQSLFCYKPKSHCVFVLGNESDGISSAAREIADVSLGIPMENQVESLNVAVTATLIAYSGYLDR